MVREPSDDGLIGHLEEIRRRLIRCLVILVVLLPLGWPLSQPFIDWLKSALCPPELGALYYTQPMELFFLRLKLALIFALAVGFPLIGWQLWRFVAPALYPRERRLAVVLSLLSSVLFVFGAGVALFGVFPLMMRYAIGMQTVAIKPLITVSSCIGMACWMMLGFGICFQLPIVLIGLMKLGLVTAARLRHARPYIVIGIFVVAGILTPPDIISQLALGLPTWLLYEISLLIGDRMMRPPPYVDPYNL